MRYLISEIYVGDGLARKVDAFQSLAACDRYFELMPAEFRDRSVRWSRAVGDVGVRPPFTQFTEAEIAAAEGNPITLAEVEAWQAIEELRMAHIEHTQDAIFDIVFGDEAKGETR